MSEKTAEQLLKEAQTIVTADKLEKARKAKERKAQHEKELKEAQARMVKEAADRAEARARGEETRTGSDFTMEPEPVTVESWAESNRNGEPLKGYANALVCVRALKLKCAHDVFLNIYTVTGQGLNHFAGKLTDPLVRQFRELCIKSFDGFEPGKEASFDALLHACEENPFNSLQDMLLETTWDGVPRLDTWTVRYLGMENTELHRVEGALFLMAAVRRPFDPGCWWHYVPVLEGIEGSEKSSFCKVLACGQADRASVYFSEAPILHQRAREQQELTEGKWIYELAEMAGMKKADQYMVKNFITAEAERARAAYDRLNKDQLRCACFIGTFNPDVNSPTLVEYLNRGDRRRWWPWRVGKIDLAAFKRDRLQLLAEAMVRAHEEPDVWDDTPLMSRPWRELRLPPHLWEAAGDVAAEREVPNPLALRLEGLFERLTTRKADGSLSEYYASGDHSWRAGVDWVVSATDVWVTARMIVELVGKWDPSGRNAAGAMATNGWQKERRGSAGTKGYVHER
jgi:hypothetical protein